MSQLTSPLDTPIYINDRVNLPVEAATIIYAGGLVAVNAAGNAVPANDTAGLKTVGRAAATVDNTAGVAGALTINVDRGVLGVANSETNPADQTDVLSKLYVESDSVVATTTTHSISAGICLGFDAGRGLVLVDTRRAV